MRETGKYAFINPLLECDYSPNYKNFQNLQNQINNYIEENIENQNITDISYYFQEFSTGENFWYNEYHRFSPASLLKIPLALTLLNDYSLEQLQDIYVKNEFQNNEIADRNIWEDTLEFGKEYRLSDLLQRMLINSDNNSAQNIYTFLGEEKLQQTYEKLGISNLDIDYLGNLSVKKYASFFRVLYNASYISRNASEYVLSELSKSTFTQWLRSDIPEDILISNKFWERIFWESNEKQLHDCGIIYYPQNPYLLCIMSRGADFSTLEQIIQHISHLVYEDMKNKYPLER